MTINDKITINLKGNEDSQEITDLKDKIVIRFKESEETINLEETFKVQISGGTTLNYDEETGKIQLLDKKNNVLSEIDLPTERIIKSVRYDETTSELVFEFDYAQEIRVPIGDLFNLEDYFNKVQILSLLEEKANKSEIPTKLSQLSNDKGYLTSVPSEYAKKNELFDKDYNKLINKPNIPSKLSDLEIDMELGVNEEEVLEIVENNSNQVSDEYTLATSQDVDKTSDNQLPTSKAVQKLIDESTPKIDLPTKLSDFENDKLFVNEQEVVEIVEEKIDESSTTTQNAINSINDKITQLQELINNNEIDIEQKNTLVNNSIVEINKDIEGIKQILTSDDVDYDTLQELVNALKNNVSSISDIFTELSKKALNIDLVSHKINTNNPHNVTKDQVGLSNVDNTSDINKPISNAVQEALNNKANKDEVPTKLSELEIDLELGVDEEEVLDIIENNSEQVNNEYTLATSENFNETSDTQIPTSKAINDRYAKKSELFSKNYNDLTDKPTIPTKTSELENNSGYVTETVINEVKATVTTLGNKVEDNENDIESKVASINNEIENIKKVLTSDDVDYDTLQELVNALKGNVSSINDLFTELSKKVDKVNGKDLSTNDYTTEEKNKLKGIEAGANNYILPNDVVQDSSYIHTDNNYTTVEKNKLAGLSNYDDTEIKNTLSNKANTSQLFSKSYNDLTDKPTIPTKTSELENNSGYLTTHQDISGKADKSYVDTKVANLVNSAPEALDTLKELSSALGNDPNFATTVSTEIGKKENKANLKALAYKDSLGKSDVGLGNVLNVASYSKTETDNLLSSKANTSQLFSGKYDDLTGKPTIPTKTSQLTNDSGYLTSHQDISGKADISYVDTAISNAITDVLNTEV